MEQFKFPSLNLLLTSLRHLAASGAVFILKKFEVKDQSKNNNQDIKRKTRKPSFFVGNDVSLTISDNKLGLSLQCQIP